jgi:hypothetical protein
MDGAEEQEGFHRKLWVVLIEAHKFRTLERTRAFPVIFINIIIEQQRLFFNKAKE